MVFLYEALAQLAFVYPARHAHGRSLPNRTLNLIVAVSIGLQLSTALLPGLRSLLGVEVVEGSLWFWIGGALLASWGFAELYTRFTRRTDTTRTVVAATT